MNVLHISTAKTWRGGERQTFYLIEGKEIYNGQVFLMSPKNSVLSEKVKDIVSAQLHFGGGILNLLPNIRRLTSFCQKHKIDIIHGHDSHAHTLLWMAYRFGGLKSKSVVSRRLNNPIKSKSIKKYNYPKINKIICVSEVVKNTIAERIEDKSRLEVVYSGVELGPDYHKMKIAHETFTVGYVAAFTSEKDHDTFMKSAKEILKVNKDIKFLLVGDGPLLDAIKESVRGQESNFEFRGFVSDIEKEYARMDLLMHPSKSEALGTAILDGMKFELPIVTTNVGGIPEIVKGGENGFLHRQGDFLGMANSVLRLIESEELYRSTSKLSLQHVIRFNKDRTIDETFKIYYESVKM